MIKKFKIKCYIVKLIFCMFRIFKIKKNKIVISSYYGNGFGDNSKYVVESLKKKDKNNEIDIVWLLNDIEQEMPDYIRKVKNKTIKAFFELATAKIWIDNCRKCEYILKRKKQVYFQLWHGSLGLKKVEYDTLNSLTEDYINMMSHDNEIIDYMTSGSDFFTDRIRNSFKYKGKILNCGHPRDDILFNYTDDIRKKVVKYFNIKSDTKILVYAPTFRNDFSAYPYDIDENKLLSLLNKNSKDKWIIINRLHPNIAKEYDKFKNLRIGINGTNYPDMQELICAADLIISDYSSLMFDAILANKPVILYANDIKDYIDNKGIYINIKKLPFPIAENNEELQKIIKNTFNYEENYKRFLKDFNVFEKGNASEYLANKILDIIIEKNK